LHIYDLAIDNALPTGQMRLTFNGQETGNIPVDVTPDNIVATTTNIRLALESLPPSDPPQLTDITMAVGDVKVELVSVLPVPRWSVRFTDQFYAKWDAVNAPPPVLNLPDLTGVWTGDAGPLVITTRRREDLRSLARHDDLRSSSPRVYVRDLGDPAQNELVQIALLGAVTGGTFTLRIGDAGTPSGPIAFDASADAVQAAIAGLAGIGNGNVVVTKATADSPWRVEFIGALAGAVVGPLKGGFGNLVGIHADGDVSPLIEGQTWTGWFVIGDYMEGEDSEVGPHSAPPSHTFPGAELLPQFLVGRQLDKLTDTQRSTFRVVRAVSEVECVGFFDCMTAYDKAVISAGPCHWTLGDMGASANRAAELPAYLAYYRDRLPERRPRCLRGAGAYPPRAVARRGQQPPRRPCTARY
jgi:hypothetical protein